MANAYGTKEYDKYIETYCNLLNRYENIKTERTENHFEINGIHFDTVLFDNNAYESENATYPCWHTIFSEIIITLKNGQTKTYNTVEACCEPQVFNYNGVDYIFIKKTLYGYCIIDTRNFDEYNYFPSDALQGDEAFISCEVHCLKDLLLMVGCYWAGPYEIFVLDLESKKIIRLDECIDFKGIENYDIGNSSVKVYDNGFAVINENKDEFLIDYGKLKRNIEQSESYDL